MKYRIQFDNEEAKMDYLEKVYTLKKGEDLKMLPKLPESHTFPMSFQDDK